MLAWPCRQAEAQNNIALCYESGEGVKRSLEEAVKWYVLAKKKQPPLRVPADTVTLAHCE